MNGWKRSRLFSYRRLQLGERLGMVVHAQVSSGYSSVGVDEQRRRLLAALVAAGGLAGLQRREQALARTAGRRALR